MIQLGAVLAILSVYARRLWQVARAAPQDPAARRFFLAVLVAFLPSVVAGMVDKPVVAVPTSVGYGVANGGQTALNAMLASCAQGLTVTNIDNGFGAACAAARIINSSHQLLNDD